MFARALQAAAVRGHGAEDAAERLGTLKPNYTLIQKGVTMERTHEILAQLVSITWS